MQQPPFPIRKTNQGRKKQSQNTNYCTHILMVRFVAELINGGRTLNYMLTMYCVRDLLSAETF